MAYSLGIDLGTTFSAAAVHRDGRTNIVELGSRSASIPSVVFLRDDEAVLAGDTAQRRSAAEPLRVAREFKRRLGDTTPMLLGGSPYSAEALTAHMLRWIVDQVADREGGQPSSIVVTHPANWGPYKLDLLQQAVRLAGLDQVNLVTEPEAAVRHYAIQNRVEAGSVIAVYDLGGGTFDAALLRKTEIGFEPLGRPEGIERLGGIDFDAAVLGHVVRALDGTIEALDQDDPGTLQALARLRQDCVDAKEALSGDTEVSIPVLLPNLQTEVRLTRAEFEAMVRPSLANSLDAMRRALASADVEPDDVSAVLLVGGSSRIPLVAQLVSNEFGRPIAIDTDPKHAVALGAALVAAEIGTSAPAVPLVAGSPSVPAADAGGEAESSETPRDDSIDDDSDRTEVIAAATTSPVRVPESASVAGELDDEPSESRSKVPLYAGAALAAIVALITGFVIVNASGGSDPETASAAETTVAEPEVSELADDTAVEPGPTTVTTSAPVTTVASEVADAAITTEPAAITTEPAATTTEPAPTTTLVQPTLCPEALDRTACITEISIDTDGGIVAEYEVTGYSPQLPGDFHIHFYLDSVVGDDERNAGSEGSGGDWRLWDGPNPFAATGGNDARPGYTLAEAQAVGATQLCSVVATATHAAVVGTGNCIDIPDGG